MGAMQTPFKISLKLSYLKIDFKQLIDNAKHSPFLRFFERCPPAMKNQSPIEKVYDPKKRQTVGSKAFNDGKHKKELTYH